jgi:hypothetical protein
MSKFDCPTTDPSQWAKCKCGHTSKGTKYCDIEGGDDEWLEAYSLVSINAILTLFKVREIFRAFL